MFRSLPALRLPDLTTLFGDDDMHLTPEEGLSIQSKEPLPVSREGFEEVKARWGLAESVAERLGRNVGGSEGVGMRRRATESVEERQQAKLDAQQDEIIKLRVRGDKYKRKYEEAQERIAELEHEIGKASMAHQEVLRRRERHIRAMTDRLTQTEELLAMRSEELSVAQSFLSTTDRLSETEVLGIARDLNENIFQVAANLTEEWEKFRSSRHSRFTISQDEINAFSQDYGPVLIKRALKRKPTAVTFLVQSCLCDIVTEITSRWRHDQGLAVLASVYERLSASEEQAISARWRSLTHNYLSQPPPDTSSLMVEYVGDVLWVTGSFPSSQRSSDFVKNVALKGIEAITQLALRLESAFMVEVTSSDMSLLFERPRTVFDRTRMINEFGSDTVSTTSSRGEIAGTIELGVGKSVGGKRGEGRRTEVLLRAKVVLEKDVAGS